MWSVGCNPFSMTSQGWHMSKFQSDAISRSYIITTLEESIQIVNSAIHLLVMERTSILVLTSLTNMCKTYCCNFVCILHSNWLPNKSCDALARGELAH